MSGQEPQGRIIMINVEGDFEHATWAAFIDFLYAEGNATLQSCDVEELVCCASANQYYRLQVLSHLQNRYESTAHTARKYMVIIMIIVSTTNVIINTMTRQSEDSC